MSDPQRRDFLAAAGTVSLAALAMALPAAGGDPSFMNNVPDPLLAGKELPTFKFALEKSKARSSATATARRPRSSNCRSPRGSPASRCGSSPGRCANCTGTPPPPNGPSSSRAACAPPSSIRKAIAETNDFEPGDVWYFPRGHGHMLAVPRRQALPLHPDLRQRLLLRVRHVQHHRLDRPHAARRCWPRISACPKRPSTTFPRDEVYFARGAAAARAAADAAAGLEAAAGDAQVPAARPAAARHLSRAAASGASISTPFPDLEDDHRRRPRSRSRRAARAALASQRRRVAIRHRGRGQRHAVRLARPLPDRALRRATSATSRKATATRSRTSATSRPAS